MSIITDSPSQNGSFIERLIEKCGRNPFIVCVFLLGAIGLGLWSIRRVPLDAVPDLSDTQVIINTSWTGRSPELIEDQVTYPIVTSLLGAPKVKYVRGLSMFGESFVYVVFKDGTDLYWARTRVLEYLQQIAGRLPPPRPVPEPSRRPVRRRGVRSDRDGRAGGVGPLRLTRRSARKAPCRFSRSLFSKTGLGNHSGSRHEAFPAVPMDA